MSADYSTWSRPPATLPTDSTWSSTPVPSPSPATTDSQCDLEKLTLVSLAIMANVSIIALFLLILTVFGSFRRRCASKWIGFPVYLAYVASVINITTAIGQMQGYDYDCPDMSYAFWAVFLLFALASSDSISALSLDECDNRLRSLGRSSLQAGWGILIVLQVLILKPVHTSYRVTISCFWVLAVVKALERTAVLMSSSRPFGLARANKLTADFMSYEDAHWNIEGYNYLVRVPLTSKRVEVLPPNYRQQLENTDSVVTVQKVWECNGRLLRQDDRDNRRKDICLSYALFRILRCRFAGYTMPEYLSHTKTWKLVRDELTSKESGHERVFRIIETELAFLYDFFYTKYPVVTRPQYLFTMRLLEVIVLFVSCAAAASNLRPKKLPEQFYSFFTSGGTDIEYILTLIVISTIIVTVAVQLVYIIFSDWTKINCLSAYVQYQCLQNNPFVEMLIRFLCYIQWKPWERKLGQYSLLKSFHSKLFVVRVAKPFALIKDVPRKGQKESKRVPLVAEVKMAIIEALKAYGQDRPSQLTNGIASLRRNGVADKLDWDCGHQTRTPVILVWHIATSLCEMHFIKTQGKKKAKSLMKSDKNLLVATKLSKYCAYLVAFQPRLLPDHSYATRFIFDQMIQDVTKELKELTGCNGLFKNIMYKKLMDLGNGNTILKKGAKLGRDLIGLEDHWKVLADFWAELMLYLAPSNDLMAHAERLAFAGEFITHLWALLFHAGIISQDSATFSYDTV